MKKIFFCTNTKMSMSHSETLSYLAELENLAGDLIDDGQIELSVMPSFTALHEARAHAGRILLGAQNVCAESGIEHTGEIPARMLKELGTDIVLVGHSERRRMYGDTNQQLRKKIRCVLDEDMKVMLSISETAPDKERGISPEVLRIQLRECLSGLDEGEIRGRLEVLYEPAWAIGASGKSAPPDYAGRMHHVIRGCLKELFGAEQGAEIPILYGGSVNPENACGFIGQKEIDGLGIGRSAWNAQVFNHMIRNVLTAAL